MDTANMLQHDFLDVLFDNRNKDYGAYHLRRYYERRMLTAVGITLGILLLMTGAYVISNTMVKGAAVDLAAIKPRVITIAAPPAMPEEKIVPPPPPATSAPRAWKPAIRNTVPAVVPDDAKNITPPPRQDEMGGKLIGSITTPGDVNGADIDAPVDLAGNGGGAIVHPPATAEGSNDHPATFVSVMPSFPGGEAALAKFLHDNMRYPSMAQENGVQGTVAVQFVVTNDGTIQGVKVVGALHGAGLEEEAMRVVRKMPKWKPGRQNGREVAVYFTLPIRFVMQE